jgi:hypothetical protein
MHKVTHDLPPERDSASGSIAGVRHGLVAKQQVFTTLPDPMSGPGAAFVREVRSVGVSPDCR